MGLNTLSSGLAILFFKLCGNLLNISLMHLMFCISFYLTKGGDPSIWGSDIGVDILLNEFLDVVYFLIVFI